MSNGMVSVERVTGDRELVSDVGYVRNCDTELDPHKFGCLGRVRQFLRTNTQSEQE